jgi:hypothetical protein
MSMPIPSLQNYKTITNLQAYSKLDTSALFRGTSITIDDSPIDQFFINTEAINRIFLSRSPPAVPAGSEPNVSVSQGSMEEMEWVETVPSQDERASGDSGPFTIEEVVETPEPTLTTIPTSLPAEVSAMVVLGYMSAIESYFRALVRGLIHIDHHVQKLAEPMTVSFAAALHHTRALLPEALIEDMSFAGAKSVQLMLKEIIGIKGNLPVELDAVLAEFKKICEIRHCCVHRFGRLGAKNAQVLGMAEHSANLENAFAPTFDDLLTIADILRTFVKTINNFVFQSVVERLSDDQSRKLGIACPWVWSWNYERDRERFAGYYVLFASKIDSPPSAGEDVIYESLKVACQERRANGRRRARAESQPANVQGSAGEMTLNSVVAHGTSLGSDGDVSA